MYTKALLLFNFIISSYSYSQLQIINSTNLTTLVEDNFAITGDSIRNVQYEGAATAISEFVSNTNLPIDSGVILTTGQAIDAIGPNDSQLSGINHEIGGSTILTSLSGNNTFDAAILSFEIKSLNPIITFEYAFASEEYPEYVFLNTNDVMAVFISHIDSNNHHNIANVGGLSVSVNSIHDAGTNVNGIQYSPLNSQYYIDNSNGANIQYDAFTTALYAPMVVVPGEWYSVKIGIADGGDGLFDSAMFIRRCPVPCTANLVEQSLLSGYIYPNPSNGTINIPLNNNSTIDLTVTDLSGRIIVKESIPENTQVYQLNNLPNGTFILSLQSKKGVHTERIIVE